MTLHTLRVATRQSPMALWQANHIKSELQHHYPNLYIEIIGLTTAGDHHTDRSLVNIGGKDLFVKELQRALLTNKADIAVHCIKDMSVQETPGLKLSAICKRNDPRDVFVSNRYTCLADLPKGAIVGTASPRRQCLLQQFSPQVKLALIRGNVNTRIEKLDNNEYDAIILAMAGLQRVGLAHRVKEILPINLFIPAIAQGALGIECRENDMATQKQIDFLHDKNTAICIEAERAVNRRLGGDCHTPIGAHATLNKDVLFLNAFVGNLETAEVFRSHSTGQAQQATVLGTQLAEALLKQGAADFL